MTKEIYALSGEDQRREFDAIQVCWKHLAPLDTQARNRALNWLAAWVRSEAPEQENSMFGIGI